MSTPASFDPEKPLAQLPGEKLKPHAALLDYYQLGDGRSMTKLLERYRDVPETSPTRRLPTLKTWSVKFSWQARIEAQKLLDDAEDARVWAARRQAIREADFQQAEKLRKLANDILDQAPSFIKQKRRRVKGENGEPDQVIVTLELNPRLLIDAAKLSSDLARRAAGMAEQVAIEHSGEVTQIGMTLEEWKQRQAANRQQAAQTLAQFDETEARENE